MSVEHIYRWEKLKIAAGLMYYYYQDDANSGFFPGIDMSYKINSKIKLYAGINTGMRLPTFTDLYYSGPSNIGNSSLKAESQIAYQVGTKLKTKLFELDLQLYINDAHNSIDWVRKADTLKWQPMNITSVQSYGGDFSLEIFTRNIGLKWIQKLSFKYSYLDKNSNSPDFQSHYIMDYLKHKFVMNIQHKIYENLSMGYVFHYHNRVGEFQKYDSQTRTFSNKEYSPYALFDMRLMWKYKQFKVFADISNVFDVQYFDYGNLPQAGRWFTLGVKTRIGL
jgi:iron complex outermembrane receptor protein